VIVCVSFIVPFLEMTAVVGSNVTPVTDTLLFVTVTAHVAVLLPSSVLAVMVAVPTFTPVTVQGVSVAVV